MPDTSSLPKEASHATAQENSDASTKIAFDDEADFERARRGLIATLPEGKVTIDSQTVWDCSQYDFLRENSSAPDTVHPGLWRQGRLNAIHGLFEVMDGVWQVRGYDISNLTLVAGKTGWILIDVLTTAATAKACLELANEHLGARPVKAVIYTHSHADHFGGILGVTTAEEVERGQVRIIAPEGFLEEVVNENVIAGAAMARRAMYQFGLFLDPGPFSPRSIFYIACNVCRSYVFNTTAQPPTPGDGSNSGPNHEVYACDDSGNFHYYACRSCFIFCSKQRNISNSTKSYV